MDFLLFAQSGINDSLLWPFLIIVALAIVIWLLSWLLFPDPKPQPVSDSLRGLTGLDETMAGKLQRFGVHTDRDLIRLTPRGQQELESQLNLHNGEYASWRQQILDRWRQRYLPHALRDIDAIYPDPELGGLYSKKPEEFDDLSKLNGIDHLTANRMNAAGIYTYEQLRLMTPEQQASFKKRFNLSGFTFDSVPAHGVTAASLANRMAAAKRVGTSGTSVGADVSATGTGSATTASLATPAGRATGAQIPTSKVDAELGRVYTAPPPHRDDLAELAGIDTTSAKKMNEAGIYTIDQLLSLTPAQQAGFKRRFDLPHADFSKWRRPTSSTGVGGPASTASSGITTGSGSSSSGGGSSFGPSSLGGALSGASAPGTGSPGTASTGASSASTTGNATGASSSQRASATSSGSAASGNEKLDIGYQYVNPPHNADDLTKLEGITPEIAKQLNLAGIYRFHQLNTMTIPQRVNFKKRFAVLRSIDFGDWTNILRGADAASSAQGPSGTTAGSASTGVRSHQSQSNPQATTSSSSGFTASPSTPVTSGGTPSGTGSGTAAASSSHGSSSSGTSARPVGFASASSGSSSTSENQVTARIGTSQHARFGRVYQSPPDQRDDLSRLQGIDEAAEKRLNTAGIYTYDQLRELNGEQLSAIQNDLKLDPINFADWRRCIHAWSRGIETTAEVARSYKTGWLHGVRLPEIASGVFDGQQLVAYPEQVVFRGSEPEHWGTKIANPLEGVSRSLPADEVRSDINYVRIRRVDTRESVVAPITKGNLFAPGPNEGNGWNGLCESFFGGRHLGIFARDIPNEVETRFGVGGWGFGHRFDHNDRQEWAWAGRVIEPTTFEISVGHIGSPSGTVIFRSNDPTIWNQRVKSGENHMAIPVDAVTHPVSFLRLLRVDTGEAVIIRVDRASLLRRGENPRLGWNGLCDHFSGGHHLGIYHRDAPQAVEICYGEGGWGFGHPYDDNDRQAFGWGGHAIGGPTLFEVSVLEHLPDYLRHELME